MAASRSTFKPQPEQAAIPPWLAQGLLWCCAVANLIALRGGVFLALVGLRSERPRHPGPTSSTSGLPGVWCSMAFRHRPMTGTSRSRSRSRSSARILSATLPGTIRRRSCSSHLLLAQLPYSVAYHRLGRGQHRALSCRRCARSSATTSAYLLALAVPMAFINALVGQNGFLTAALIGGALYLIPMRPVLAGICLGLLTLQAAIRAAVSDRADRSRRIGACSSAPA